MRQAPRQAPRQVPRQALRWLVVILPALAAGSCAPGPSHQTGGPTQTGEIIAGTEGVALPAVEPIRPRLRVAILPDRTTGRDWGLKYLAMAVDDLNRIQPDAVISIGDMVQGYTRSMERYRDEVAEFRSHVGQLRCPFYPLAGNHDVVSGTRLREDRTFEDEYKRQFGPLYYTIEFELATFIILYSEDELFEGGEGIGHQQIAWLKQQLERHRSDDATVFVLMHRPLWRSDSSRWNEEVHGLLADAGVDAVIAGHFHSMQRDPDRDDIQYHILGVCGGMIDQHPLTGQLQHLTFVTVREDGTFSVHHAPVGTTLPDDFILAVDQNRAWRIKSDHDIVGFTDAITDPFQGPVDSSLMAIVSNPLDIPVQVEVGAINHAPGPTIWDSAMWLSRTQQDQFNAFITNVKTPLSFEAPPPVMLKPGESREIMIGVRTARTDAPIPPAEIWFTYTFEDSRGRSVPVVVRRRTPIARAISPRSDRDGSARWPISPWFPSVYDTLEANPGARIFVEGSDLRLEVDVPDDVRSADSLQDRAVHERFRNPRSDALLIQLGSENVGPRLFVEPFRSRAVFQVEESGNRSTEFVAQTMGTNRGWRIVLRIPLEWISRNLGDLFPMNIGVADNDDTYHTQWRWLAPRDVPMQVDLTER